MVVSLIRALIRTGCVSGLQSLNQMMQSDVCYYSSAAMYHDHVCSGHDWRLCSLMS